MNLGTYPKYNHSGKFTPHELILAFVVPALVSFPAGLLYSSLVKWIPFIYLNFLITLGYGFGLGLLTGKLIKVFKVRNGSIAVIAGCTAGLFGLYFDWNGHVHTLINEAPLFCWPNQILDVMRVLYQEGSWGLSHGSNVTGIMLGIVWAIEAIMIIGLSTVAAYSIIAEVPFCEKSGQWLDEEKKINSLEAFTNPTQIAALASGNLSPLSQARGKVAGSSPFGRLTIRHSPQCDEFCTLTISNITVTVDKDGKAKEEDKELVKNLILPKSMLESLGELEHLKPGMNLGA